MSAAEDLPKQGERVTIRWPGGDYDFVIEFSYAEELPDGWLVLHGLVVEPVGIEHRMVRGFQVRRVGDDFALLPKLPTRR